MKSEKEVFIISKIILSSDSTCDLSLQLKEKYNVSYYPFHIILGEKSYTDNVDITADEIYRAWWDKKLLPKTAAINIMEYKEYFKQFTNRGFEVIHLNLGGALSSSAENARLAAEALSGVYTVDSKNLSTGIGHLVIRAGELISEGKLSASDIAANLRELTGKVHASFILDTRVHARRRPLLGSCYVRGQSSET